jgi:DNA-binding SARP family transcriptional activator
VARIDFRVLGPLEVRREGEFLTIPAPKQRALLGLLLLHANEPVSQEELIDGLWGDAAPRTARASLQNQVHALRKLLGSETLERQTAGYVLHVETGELDLERFERLVAEARQGGLKERSAKLREALALWRGPALVEFPSEPFAQHEILRLDEERLTALEDRIDVDLELSEHVELIAELESLVDRYPLRERMWGQLMLALYRSGRQADALAAYGRAHETFVGGLGIEPGVTLRELQRAILVQDPRLDDAEHRFGWTLERAAAILPWPPQDQAESLYEYGLALMRTGELRRGISTLEAAARLAAPMGETGIEERARLYLSYLAVWSEGTSPLEFLDEAEHAARRFEDRGDYKGILVALRLRYQLVERAGRADEAAMLAARAAELAAQQGDRRLEAACLHNRALFLATGSTPVREATAVCEALLASEEVNDPSSARSVLNLWVALALLYAQAGRVDEARVVGERAVAQGRRQGLLSLLLGAIASRGQAELIAGNLSDAARHLRSAYAVLETEDDRLSAPIVAAELACVLALTGDLDEAHELAVKARARTSPDVLTTEVAWRRALALIAAHESRLDEAVRLSDEAQARAEASDWLTYRGQTLEEAAIVRRLAGDTTGEAEALEEALAVYERKGNVVGADRVREAMKGDTSRSGLSA